MYETAIEEVLYSDPTTKNIFLGAFARDELPPKPMYPSCFILNTAPRSSAGEHWLALYYDQHGMCDFFDSYGMPPGNFGLVDYLNSTAISWKYNKQRIQGISTLCGHYCIFYLLFRSRFKTINFFGKFNQNYKQNDNLIKKLLYY